MIRTFFLGLVAVFLASCGAETVSSPQVGPQMVRPQLATDYVAVTENDFVTSNIAGVAFIQTLARDGATNEFTPTATDYAAVNGTYDHRSATVTLSNNLVSDMREDTALRGRDLSAYRYTGVATQFLKPFPGEDGSSNRRLSSRLVFGIPTRREDTTFLAGSADYIGDAFMTYDGPDGFMAFPSDATVSANFDRGRVNVVITPEGDLPAGAPFDQFARRNMLMNGAVFSGGYAEFSQNGEVFDLVGPNAESFGKGRFFGPVTGIPAEVGGMIRVNGPLAEVVATFVAR